MNGTVRLAKKSSSFVIYVSNFLTSNCLTYSPHDVLVVYPTSHQSSLEHIAQQLMLLQNLITSNTITAKSQCTLMQVHCITGHARLMLHRHDLYLNWYVSFLFELVLITVNLC